MSWKSIGEGEQSNLDYHYTPIRYTPPPQFPTYQVIMDSLKSILQPINDRFDPEKQYRRAQLAEYMSPQAQQLRQREMTLREQNVGLQGENIGMQKELLPAKKAMAEAQAKGMTDAYSQTPQPDQYGRIFNKITGKYDTISKDKLDAIKWQHVHQDMVDALKLKGAPPTGPNPQIPRSRLAPGVSFDSDQPIQVTPPVPPDPRQPSAPVVPTNPVGSTSVDPRMVNNDNQISMTPQGIVNPELNVAPDIMTDPAEVYG